MTKKKKGRAWNKQWGNVKMACWNPWGLCNERLNYCKLMDFDVLGLTELHNVHNKKAWRKKYWITSEDAKSDDSGKCFDPASGVAILLSHRFSTRILAQGSVGSRIVWVRLDGPVCPLFIVCVYVPHKFRKTAPLATETLTQLDGLLSNCKALKSNDCVVVMGDLNCELPRNIQGYTGKWFMNKRHDDGHSSELLSLMRAQDLFAVDSLFRPKRRKMFNQKKKRVCNATWLQKDVSLRPKKLDYFLVSNRWRSCVSNSKACWAPSVHRFGRAFDHSLLQVSWKWRVKKERLVPAKDFKAMTDEKWSELNEIIADNLLKHKESNTASHAECASQAESSPDSHLTRMNTCIQAAIQTCVPSKKRLSDVKRETSERTRQIYEARAQKFSKIAEQGGTVTKQLRKRWNRKIRDANLRDYNDWLDSMATKMEEADRRGDSETIFRIVKIVSGLMTTATSQAPSVDSQGDLILDHQKLAAVWQDFLQGKFKATDAESKRDPYEELGPQLVADPLTEQAFVRALQKLKKGKACGPDGIPGEVFLNCESAARELYNLLKTIWEREYVPPELVRAAFIMIFKNKGSRDDPSKYRCIGLLPHAYKILSLVMLERIMNECAEFLSDWQAGFRPERGCRDNILLLRVLFDQIIKSDQRLFVTYIDYSAAFDSVSHKFLDASLARAGASRKTRAMFRAIYAAAEGTARVRGLRGNKVYSASFKVRRGVIQGDIISPIFFILAMEQVFRLHDPSPAGVSIGNYLQIGVLGYADDAALTSLSADRMNQRLSSVSRGSKADADMDIHKGKTKNMVVERQAKMQLPTEAAVKKMEATYAHECEFCGRRCKTARGLKIHKAACNKQHGLTDEEYIIERINATFGTPQDRWYRVEWQGHPGKDSWEPERSLIRQGCELSIKVFWDSCDLNPSTDFIADPDDVWRCWTCGKGYKSCRTLKAHITRTHPARSYRGSTADKDTRRKMHADAQEDKEYVFCEGCPIDNVWLFKYLGSRFRADGDQTADVKARIAAANAAAGKMRAIWAARTTPLKLKMRIYKTGVCSRLTYGCEAWRLDKRTCAMINGANSRMVAHITNRTPHEEASEITRTFDILRWIRARRLQWVGHILRMDPSRMVYRAVQHIHENKEVGDLLMDTPPEFSWNELLALAENRPRWRGMVQALRDDKKTTSRVKIVFNPSLPGCTATRHSARIKEQQRPARVASPSARKYIARDAHELFFRPKAKGTKAPQQHKPKKKKKPSMTNKQRAAWARAHYALHHGHEDNLNTAGPPTTPTTLNQPTKCSEVLTSPQLTSLSWSPTSIQGHHRHHQVHNTTMTPPTFGELMQHLDNRSADHKRLHNLSDLHF